MLQIEAHRNLIFLLHEVMARAKQERSMALETAMETDVADHTAKKVSHKTKSKVKTSPFCFLIKRYFLDQP
jgi:hypothetical protein